jgi:hypothetical protein
MNVYVILEGHHHVLKTVHSSISVTITGTNGDVSNQSDIDKATKKQEDWNKDNKCVIGYIRLCVSLDIAQLIKGKDSTKEMWDSLKKGHSRQMLANAYIEFKSILNMRIPEDQSPATALAKIQAYIECLNTFHINLNEYIYLLVNKTPGYTQMQASILVMAQEIVDTIDPQTPKDKHPKPLEYAKTLEAS